VSESGDFWAELENFSQTGERMAANGSGFPNGMCLADADTCITAGTHGISDPMVGELMARLSHDLRTPLNAIIGFSEILECELLGPVGSERYQGYATHIRESGLNLLAAVETALALTQRLAEANLAAPGEVLGARRC
jgi:signal transduction histidine kinase